MHIYLALLASVIGLGVSTYIYRKKRTKTRLVCPLRTRCDLVIHSTHATTFGIGNELLGILYYILMGALYSFLALFPTVYNPVVLYIILITTMLGVLFSIYLIALQALVIRAWCMWCLLSAFANVLLVIALFHLPTSALYAMIGTQRILWVMMHNIGFILGIGAATITDVFFFRFLKDNMISVEEKGTMDTLTNVIWVGIAILVASGIMLYLPDQVRLATSSKFIVKIIVIFAIIGNGILLNMLIAPRMRQFSFEGTHPARRYRRLAFALGGISITSWYVAFILGSLRSVPLSVSTGLAIYGVLLVGVVIGSQIFERIATKAHQKVSSNVESIN